MRKRQERQGHARLAITPSPQGSSRSLHSLPTHPGGGHNPCPCVARGLAKPRPQGTQLRPRGAWTRLGTTCHLHDHPPGSGPTAAEQLCYAGGEPGQRPGQPGLAGHPQDKALGCAAWASDLLHADSDDLVREVRAVALSWRQPPSGPGLPPTWIRPAAGFRLFSKCFCRCCSCTFRAKPDPKMPCKAPGSDRAWGPTRPTHHRQTRRGPQPLPPAPGCPPSPQPRPTWRPGQGSPLSWGQGTHWLTGAQQCPHQSQRAASASSQPTPRPTLVL